MPRFYFHVHDGFDCEDEEGLVLVDISAAYEEALRGARSLMAEQLCKGHISLKGHIDIADERGRHLITVPFREAVDIDG